MPRQLSTLTEAEGFCYWLDNVDLSTMIKIDKTGFTTFTTLQIPDPDNPKRLRIVISRSETYKKCCSCHITDTEYILSNMMGETTRWGSWYDATKGVVIPGSDPVV